MKKALAFVLSMMMLLGLVACDSNSGGYDPSDSYTEITWPSSDLVSLLPVPEMLLGEINSESEDYFNVDLGATQEQFNAYVDACQEAGFTENYQKSSTRFQAYNVDGYYLYVSYYSSWQEMSITIRVPEEEESDAQDDTTTTTVKPTTATTTKAPDSGLGKEFKAAMDSYEKFMNDYVAFMKKYQANPSDLTLLAEYSEFMSDYAKAMSDFAEWEDEEMNNEELAYYLDVQTRVNKKLLEVAG